MGVMQFIGRTALFSGSPCVISGVTIGGDFGWNPLIDKVFLNAAGCISGGSGGAVLSEHVRLDIEGVDDENLKS